jgi:hypothetical protein
VTVRLVSVKAAGFFEQPAHFPQHLPALVGALFGLGEKRVATGLVRGDELLEQGLEAPGDLLELSPRKLSQAASQSVSHSDASRSKGGGG